MAEALPSDSPARSGPLGARWLLVAAAVVVVVAGLRAAAPILLPFAVATFLALLSFPVVAWLVGLRVRLSLAVLVTVLAEVGLLLVAGLVMSGAFNEFARAAPGYLEQIVRRLREAAAALELRGVDVSDWFAVERIDPSSLVDFAGGVLGGTVKGVASVVSFMTLILIILVCLLFEGAGLPEKLRRALGPSDRSLRYLAGVTGEIQRFLGVKTTVSAVTGVLLGTWVWALDVPFPLVWGMLAFLLNFIPAIGSILAAVPPVLLSLVVHGPGRAAIVAAGYLVVNFLLGNLLEPLFMGRRFGLSTLVVFLSLMFWGWVWGPIGMLLSVPLTMIVKITLEQSPDLSWIALLLGPNHRPPPLAPPET